MKIEDVYDRIRSKKKREEIWELLNSEYPPHFRKVWLVGFLRYAIGLSEEEITELILDGSLWKKKDREITGYMVRSVKKEGIEQRAVRKGESRTSLAERSEASDLSSLGFRGGAPAKGSWKGIENGAGFVMEWVRV